LQCACVWVVFVGEGVFEGFDSDGTILECLYIVESVFYLGVPLGVSRKFIAKFNTSTWYVTGGLAGIAIGAYLAGMGFGYL